MKRRLLLIFILSAWMLLCGFAPKTALSVTVTDARSGAAVANATIRIAETDQTFSCPRGKCTVTPPYLPDPRYSTPPPFGTCTLVVSAKGYITTVLIGCVVIQNKTRDVTVTLFVNDGSVTAPALTFSESPPEDWLKTLVG